MNHVLPHKRVTKSISVHGIDKDTERLIRERAKAEGKSVNKIVKELIAKSLGGNVKEKRTGNKKEFAELCGIWTEEEAARFLDNIADLEGIDAKDWR